jgi:four helix bundle protein
MTYEEWEMAVPELIKVDRIWRVQAFRLAAFLGACSESDTRELADDPRFRAMAAQLCRAAASIAANIAEGYPRQSPKDRVRYYEYALGSAEEAKTWYLSLRECLAANALDERLSTLRSITRLLLTMIRSSRPPSRPTPSPAP